MQPPPEFEAREPNGAMGALLAGYVAGALDPYLHALLECHLILSDENRAEVRALEARAGEELEALTPRPLRPAARDEVLAAIYAGGWYGRPRPRKIDPDVPEPLEKLLKTRLDELPWRFAAPGVREHVLHADDAVKASLFRIRPSQKMPRHAHSGVEATLVLKGSFSDELGRYERGDVALADAAIEHRPVAGPDAPCVCYVVKQGPLRLTGPFGRWIQRFFG